MWILSMLQMSLHVTTIIKGRGIFRRMYFPDAYSFFSSFSWSFLIWLKKFSESFKRCKEWHKVKEWFPLCWTTYKYLFPRCFDFLCVWLRPFHNWLGVFWNRNGPRCSHSRAGAGRRPQCDPDGVWVREGQPSCPSGGLWGHWQSCRYPGIYPQAHRWYRVSGGIMLLLLALQVWAGTCKPLSQTVEIISNEAAPVFDSFNFCDGRMDFLSSLPQARAWIISLPNLLWLFWRGKTTCSYSELQNFSALVRDTHEHLLLFQLSRVSNYQYSVHGLGFGLYKPSETEFHCWRSLRL